MSDGRTYSEFVTPQTLDYLNELLVANGDEDKYRQAMYHLGGALGEQLSQELAGLSSICVVSTAEDADYLTRGLLEVLDRLPSLDIALVCFWHERWRAGKENISVAPITRRYIEPKSKGHVDAVIVLKSIIATSCVVRTDLTEILTTTQPDQIFIVAPVAYAKSRESLRSEFSPDVSEKFDYLYFAEDSEMDGSGTVWPGIGGSLYELLDIQVGKDRSYGPSLIKERRQRFTRQG